MSEGRELISTSVDNLPSRAGLMAYMIQAQIMHDES